MDIDEIEEWLPILVREELAFLEADFGFATTEIECSFGEVCARYAKSTVAFELRLNYLEGILSSALVLAAPRKSQPDIVLELNAILEARGRIDLSITQDDVGRSLDRIRARELIRDMAANLRDHASDVLRGDFNIIPDVRHLLKDVPGDPRFDWWVAEPEAE